MRRAPPIEPGMPRRNDRPAIEASCAARATFTSGTAVPADTRWPSSIAISPKPRPSRITTPATPPSRTMRLEPRPTAVTGTSAGSCASRAAKSSVSCGVNSTCAGPPTRNQVSSASGWLARSRPRRPGIRAQFGNGSGRSCGFRRMAHGGYLLPDIEHDPRPLDPSLRITPAVKTREYGLMFRRNINKAVRNRAAPRVNGL